MYPWRVNAAWADTFRFYGRAGVAGWTIEVSLNGANIANTGFAVAEVDAVNNAYLYEVSATAGTLATVGAYDVTVYETATPANSWSFQLRVTTDGEMSGGAGTVAWTASSGDGRITDGTSALPGATVSLQDSTNVVLQEATTDVAGLYTLYLEDNAVYNLVAAYTGYANERVSTALVVSSGNVVTSPGADIALTLGSSTGDTITFASLIAYAKRQMLNATSSQSETEAKQAINDALRWLAAEFPWSHLDEEYQVCLRAPYDTGTIAISSGTATVLGTGTTFPSWAAAASIYLGGSRDVWLEVSTRDSDTQLTLDETYDAASLTGESYKLYYTRYSKPTNLNRIRRFLGGNERYVWVSAYKMAQLRTSREAAGRTTGFYYNLSDSYLEIWPPVTTDKVYRYIGTRRPALLTYDTDIVDWDPSLLPVLRRAIDWQCAIRGACKAGDVKQTRETLQDAVNNATAGMQDVIDNDYNQTHNYSEEEEFDGDILGY